MPASLVCPQSLVIPCTVSAVSGHPLHCVRSLWASPALCPQSLGIPCTVSAVSGHPLHCVRSLWASPAVSQSLGISCTVSAVSGHLLYCVRSLWSSLVGGPQSLVISCTVSAVHWFRIIFSPLKPRCILWSGASYGAKNMVPALYNGCAQNIPDPSLL
ncbi:unnamed protein product, partial [Staurois parvus]